MYFLNTSSCLYDFCISFSLVGVSSVMMKKVRKEWVKDLTSRSVLFSTMEMERKEKKNEEEIKWMKKKENEFLLQTGRSVKRWFSLQAFDIFKDCINLSGFVKLKWIFIPFSNFFLSILSLSSLYYSPLSSSSSFSRTHVMLWADEFLSEIPPSIKKLFSWRKEKGRERFGHWVDSSGTSSFSNIRHSLTLSLPLTHSLPDWFFLPWHSLDSPIFQFILLFTSVCEEVDNNLIRSVLLNLK